MTVFSKDPPLEKRFDESGTTILKAAFTVPRRGKWDVCLETVGNNGSNKKTGAIISLRLLSGGLAKDYSQLKDRMRTTAATTSSKSEDDVLEISDEVSTSFQ